jgi:ATP-dependent Clp protease ATP-binding subunit ClpC
MAEPAFWSRADRHAVLSRYALIDRVKAATKTVESLRERLDKSRDGRGDFSREIMGRLARQVFVTAMGVEDALTDAPVEAVVAIEPALEGAGEPAEARGWCGQILRMYRGWADKRGMQIDDYSAGGETLFTVSGFGAYRLLAQEAGLHVLEGEGDESARLVARVRVAAAPLGDLPQAGAAKALRATLDRVPSSKAVVRRYRGGASPLVRDGKKAWRSGKLDAVLAGNFDLIGAIAAR